ncbi:DedA family protein [Candidatus Peregrinibacteria bacterium]|nr:DedA family protein [Candidatus Peregrinibacteria bacterium]
MAHIIDFFIILTESWGYFGIFALMTIESSFIPFPSEIVIPPAAVLAARGEMNIYLIIFLGLAGTLLGATINYFIGFTLGRRLVYKLAKTRFAKYLLIDEDKIINAENYLKKFGNISTFFGRLIPAIRQLISIPAGFIKMNFLAFIIYTSLGSGIWIIILALLGYFFGTNEEVLQKYYSEITLGLIGIVLFVIIFYLIKYLKRSR